MVLARLVGLDGKSTSESGRGTEEEEPWLGLYLRRHGESEFGMLAGSGLVWISMNENDMIGGENDSRIEHPTKSGDPDMLAANSHVTRRVPLAFLHKPFPVH
jgi:hypothetical protein